MSSVDAPVFVALRLACGCRVARGAAEPVQAFIAVRAGGRIECDRHGRTTILSSTFTLVDVPTRWVPFAKLQAGMVAWDGRQRRWATIREVDRNRQGVFFDGRRRSVGPYEPDEVMAVIVPLDELAPEARAWWEAGGHSPPTPAPS